MTTYNSYLVTIDIILQCVTLVTIATEVVFVLCVRVTRSNRLRATPRAVTLNVIQQKVYQTQNGLIVVSYPCLFLNQVIYLMGLKIEFYGMYNYTNVPYTVKS